MPTELTGKEQIDFRTKEGEKFLVSLSSDELSKWRQARKIFLAKQTYLKHHAKRLEKTNANKRRWKDKVFEKLGCRCNNIDCRWLNNDGTFGCDVEYLLQIDHVTGGGATERKLIGSNTLPFTRKCLPPLLASTSYFALTATD